MLRLVGHPVVVNPDRELLRIARQEGWEVLRCDRLGRRLKTAVGLAGAAAAGVAGSVVVAKARAPGPRRLWRRLAPARPRLSLGR
jgi:hypothetical protein